MVEDPGDTASIYQVEIWGVYDPKLVFTKWIENAVRFFSLVKEDMTEMEY